MRFSERKINTHSANLEKRNIENHKHLRRETYNRTLMRILFCSLSLENSKNAAT